MKYRARRFVTYVSLYYLCTILCSCSSHAVDTNPCAAMGEWATVHLSDASASQSKAAFSTEIAATDVTRRRGLMHREQLSTNQAMLFCYDQPMLVHMWMKNTLIPLDMLFISADGVVMHIAHNAIPHDITPISSRHPVSFVLEIAAGVAEAHSIHIGDHMDIITTGH